MKARWAVAALAAAGLVLSGCSGNDDTSPTASVVTEVTTVTASSSTQPEVKQPQTPTPEMTTTQVPQTPTPAPQAGPQLGDRCIGADIGRTAVDANGVAIMCDDYQWRANVGQTPQHKWADEQTKWAECIAQHTTEQCREMLNP